MERHTLKSVNRKTLGRKVKKLRREGILPGNVFGAKIKSFAIQVDEKEFAKVYKETGETGLIDLKVGSNATPVLVQNVQLDPVTDKPIHVDFRKVSLTQKVTADVPIELSGASQAEEQKIGILVQQMNEVEVEALPQDLPERIVLDVSGLTDVDQAITVKELKLDRSKLEVKADPEQIVVKIEPLAKEEVVEVAPGPAAEGEEETKEKVEEEVAAATSVPSEGAEKRKENS